MEVLKYSIIAKFIIKKHKRDVEIIFSVIKNVKKIKRQYFLKVHFFGTYFLRAYFLKASQEVNKQFCKVLTFEYSIMSQYNYPKMN